MKIFILGLFVCAIAAAQNTSQFGGIYSAINYAYGSGNLGALAITTGNSNTGASTITLAYGTVTLSDGVTVIAPLATNAPIYVGNGANLETVTPTALGCSTPQIPNSCRFTASFTKIHGAGERVSSGTFGLYEALNAASIWGGSAIIDGAWVQTGGTQTMVNAAPIFSNATIIDNRTGFSAGGAGNPGGTNGQIQFNNNGVFGGITPTGTGNVVKATSPTLVTPALGTPSALVLTNATGLPGGQITGANSIPAATLPLATSSAFGAVECGSGTTCTAGVISASGSGGGFIVTNTAGLPGTCPAAGTAYFVTDQPKGQQAYYCADNTSAPYQSVNLGGSTCLAFTAGSLDIVTACLPQKTAANDFTALNRYAGIAGLGSAPAIVFTTGTGSIASTSTNLDGVITSTTTGPIGFTLTWNTLTYAHRGICMFANETTHSNAVTSNAANTTTLSADGTVTTGDVITYICTGN